MLDGHEVSETERLFLMNWKAMRKARRRQQKQSLEQMPYILSEPLSSDPVILSSVPLTLPALPARQLPHRCKKMSHNEVTHKMHVLPQLVHSEEVSGLRKVDNDFKLPELAPYKSIIAQQEHLMNNLSSHHLPEKPWRTYEVMTGNGIGQR